MNRVRPLVAMSQRVDRHAGYAEDRDALDQRWYGLLDSLDRDVVALPNNVTLAQALLARLQPAAIVLSGGNDVRPGTPGNFPARDAVERMLLEYARTRLMPVVGVCRGFQMLNVAGGGSLLALSGHVRSQHLLRNPAGHSLFTVNSYHELAIRPEDLAPGWTALAMADDGSVEAARHASLPWSGIMWHPERDNIDADRQRDAFARALEGRLALEGGPDA